MKNWNSSVLAAFLGVSLCYNNASNASVVVAEYIPSQEEADAYLLFSAAIANVATYAQTFTSCTEGYITTVDLPVFKSFDNTPTANLSVEILKVTNGNPDETNNLASKTVSIDSVLPGDPFALNFTSFDFSSDWIHVRAGEQLAIVVRSKTGAFPFWYEWTGHVLEDKYPYGKITFKTGNSDWADDTVGEMGFRVSVEPYNIGSGSIPNPACNSLFQ